MRRAVACALGTLSAAGALAAGRPDSVFLQVGRTAGDTRSVTAGLAWDWDRRWSWGAGEVSGYWELALGHWSAPGPEGRESAVVTQIALTPTFRWRPESGRSPWFAEGAIGFTILAPVYEDRHKRFSTTFNFADHLAVGRDFGPGHRHTLALRFEHFSNAGIRHPNPGENFWQLRYALRW